MGFFSKKNKQHSAINDDIQRTSFMQWGIAIGLLFAVIFCMVTYFSVSSRNKAFSSVEDELILKSSTYASDISHKLELTYSAANVTAEIMSDKEKCSDNDIAWYAKQLQGAQDNTYMVIIADDKGNGYTNRHERVNISEMDYFLASDDCGYYITNDDGILHRRAYVVIVPYYLEYARIGKVYMFVAADDIAEMVPTDAYDMAASFVICDSRGKLLGSIGAETAFLENGQFVENLKQAAFSDKDIGLTNILTCFGNMGKFTFEAEYKGKTKVFVSVPLGIADWQYVTILNKGYVDRVISNEWKGARSITIQLVTVAILFVCCVITLSLVNHFRYNERNRELANKADIDLLTELNNKIATERKIQEYIEQNPDKQCMFFLFDIDNFKKINDTLGHAFGDEVLRSLGSQLSNEFRVTDIIGRTGGDEFILFLKDINSDELLEKEAKRLVDFFQLFQVGEYVKYSATSSIGVAVYPKDAKDYQGLYTAADRALYEAKRRGKNQMVFYNNDLKGVNPDKSRPLL